MAHNRKRLDKRTLAVVGIVLAVETVVCLGVVMSVHTRKAALEQTLTQKESALSAVRTVSAGLPGLQAEYQKMLAQVRCLERALPQPEYIPTLLADVERTAISSGVKIQEFRPKPAAPSGGPAAPVAATPGAATQQQFDMTITGDYKHVQKFLQNLTRFRKILALNSIKLQPATGGRPGMVGKPGTSPALTGALTLTAYVLPPASDEVGGSTVTATAPASPAEPATKVAEGTGAAAPNTGTRG